jgi:hypothetical protein
MGNRCDLHHNSSAFDCPDLGMGIHGELLDVYRRLRRAWLFDLALRDWERNFKLGHYRMRPDDIDDFYTRLRSATATR